MDDLARVDLRSRDEISVHEKKNNISEGSFDVVSLSHSLTHSLTTGGNLGLTTIPINPTNVWLLFRKKLPTT